MTDLSSTAGAAPHVARRAVASDGALIVFGCALFLIGDLLMAAWFQTPPALVVALGCALAMGVVVSEMRANPAFVRPVNARLLLGCMATSALLFFLSGAGHFLYAVDDWLTRDALLLDLVRTPAPVRYRIDGADWALRAPLGMYVLPVLAGKLAGLRAAHAALFAQNAAIVGLAFYFLAAAAPRARGVVLLLLVLSSGADAIGHVFREGLTTWPLHLEAWNPYIEIPSTVAQLLWAPNHSLPAWWFAALLALYARGAAAPATMIAMFAGLAIWSPLAMLGAAPFLLLTLVELRAQWLSPRLWMAAAAGLCFLPVAIFLQADAGSVPHEWLFARDDAALIYVATVLIEIPQALLVALSLKHFEPRQRRQLVLAMAALVAIPLFIFGRSNDFALRVTILPLMILALGFAMAAVEAWRQRGALLIVAALTVAITAPSPLIELLRNVALRPYAFSECDFITAWRQVYPARYTPDHYFARPQAMPPWLMREGGGAVEPTLQKNDCWPDHPSRRKIVDYHNFVRFPAILWNWRFEGAR